MANDGAEGRKATRRREPGKPALARRLRPGQAKLVRTVGERAVAAIVAAEHGDPFAVLGPHRGRARRLGGARHAAGGERRRGDVDAGATIPMERRHEDGFFVARFEAPARPIYRLRSRSAAGR